MKKQNKNSKYIFIIILFTLGSKFLGFIRESLIGAKFGSSLETDAFFIALSATSIVGGFLTNAISTTFIPLASEIEFNEGKEGKNEHTNNMINIMLIISILLLILGILGAPLIVKLLAKGFEDDQFKLTVGLIRLGLPMILFSGIIGIFTGYLQSESQFKATAILGIPLNISYIFFLLFLSKHFGIKGLMLSVVIGTFGQFLIQLPEIRSLGFKYKFIFNINDVYIKKLLYLSLPILLGVAINDLNIIIDRTLASSLIAGSISALNYAAKLNGLILGVFIYAITTVIFPLLSKTANDNDIKKLKETMNRGINLILLLTIPATIGLIILSEPIVKIAFQRGAFDDRATLMTSQALIFYSIGLVAMALNLLITRVYYSLQDTKTPMINGIISVIINVSLNLILVKYMAHSGLALATSIATIITTFLLLHGLKKKIGSLGSKEYIITFLKTGIASGVMGLVSYFIYHGIYGMLEISKLYNLISLLVAVGAGVVVYLILCYVFKVEEIRDAVGKIGERFRGDKA